MTASHPDAVRAPLAGGDWDRAADERADADLVARLRADPATRVLAVHGDRAPLADPGRLAWCAPDEVTATDARWAFLGRDTNGRAALVAAVSEADPEPVAAPTWGALREVGGALDATEAGVLVEAVALGRWLLYFGFCPACGAATDIAAGGWSRVCTGCGREHFPRTDPAVIVAVESADGDRLLLGRNALWGPQPRYSTFAGFVEAGESAEATIAREVAEESGVEVRSARYLGSQAWPYPRSLMLGFRAVAVDDAAARPDGEEIVDVRWFTRDEVRAALAGRTEVRMPGPASIAHALIVDWCEAAR